MGLDDPPFRSRYPAVWEFVTLTVLDGKPRQTSTLLFFREDGRWKVCLSDRDTDHVLFRAGQDLEEALAALEEALQEPYVDWRVSRKSRPR